MPPWLCDIISKLHAKNPADRFQSSREVADLLADCEAQLKADSRLRDLSRIPSLRRGKRRRWLAIAAGLVALAGVAAVAFAFWNRDKPPPGNDATATAPPTLPASSNGDTARAPGTGKEDAPGDVKRPGEAGVSLPAVPFVNPAPDFVREVHNVSRQEFDAWLAELRKAEFVPVALAAWNGGKGDVRFAAAATRQVVARGWEVVTIAQSNKRQAKVNELIQAGFRPVIHTTFRSGNNNAFSDLWVERGNAPATSMLFSGFEQFEGRLLELRGGSRRPTSISFGSHGFTLISGANNGRVWDVEGPLDQAAMQEQIVKQREARRKMVSVAVRPANVRDPFAAIFIANREQADWSADLELTAGQYEKRFMDQVRFGFVPSSLAVRDRNGPRYSVVWTRSARTAARRGELPAATQVEDLRKLLMTRNPGYDGALTPTIEDDVVVGLELVSDRVADITPIRSLTQLQKLRIEGTRPGGGALVNLAPLKRLSLVELSVRNNKIDDLSPLREMPLRVLKVGQNPVSDLAPIKEMPLKELDLQSLPVSDLKAIEGMKLERLNAASSSISDISPLKGMPLEEVRLTPRRITRGLDVLRAIGSVKTIGIDSDQVWPAAEFWARYERGEFK